MKRGRFRCDAKAFHLSKSHKKILKKMNNFLRTGQKSGGGLDGAIAQASNASGCSSSNNCTEGVQLNADCDMQMNVDQQQKQLQHQQQSEDGDGGASSALTEMQMITSNQPKIAIDMDSVLKVIEIAENGKNTLGIAPSLLQANHTENDDGPASNVSQMKESHKRGAVTGPDPTKPLQPKAKLLRQQRKAEKLLARANASPAIATAEATASAVAATAVAEVKTSIVNKAPKNTEKTLKSFIDEAPIDGKHKLKVC